MALLGHTEHPIVASVVQKTGNMQTHNTTTHRSPSFIYERNSSQFILTIFKCHSNIRFSTHAHTEHTPLRHMMHSWLHGECKSFLITMQRQEASRRARDTRLKYYSNINSCCSCNLWCCFYYRCRNRLLAAAIYTPDHSIKCITNVLRHTAMRWWKTAVKWRKLWNKVWYLCDTWAISSFGKLYACGRQRRQHHTHTSVACRWRMFLCDVYILCTTAMTENGGFLLADAETLKIPSVIETFSAVKETGTFYVFSSQELLCVTFTVSLCICEDNKNKTQCQLSICSTPVYNII